MSKAFLEYIRDNYHSHLEELKQLSASGVEENWRHDPFIAAWKSRNLTSI